MKNALFVRLAWDYSGFVITDPADIARVIAAFSAAIPVTRETEPVKGRYGNDALIPGLNASAHFEFELIEWPTAAAKDRIPAIGKPYSLTSHVEQAVAHSAANVEAFERPFVAEEQSADPAPDVAPAPSEDKDDVPF